MTAPLRVLVVDDDADTRTSFRVLLGLWGYDARDAADGAAALREAAVFLPEVVLVDIALGIGMDGYELARRLRRLPGMAAACLFALSGFGQARDVEAAARAGFDRHLLKPVDPEDLRTLLDAVRDGAVACGAQQFQTSPN